MRYDSLEDMPRRCVSVWRVSLQEIELRRSSGSARRA